MRDRDFVKIFCYIICFALFAILAMAFAASSAFIAIPAFMGAIGCLAMSIISIHS